MLQRTAATVFFRKLFTLGAPRQAEYSRIINAVLNLIQHNECRMRRTNKTVLKIRQNCAFILGKIVGISPSHCHAAVEQNGIGTLYDVAVALAPSGSELKMQCIWVLANIAADCDNCKEDCRQTNICQMLTTCLEKSEFRNQPDVLNIICCLHNVMKEGLVIHQQLAISMSHMVYEVLLQYQNSSSQILVECLWTLACIADDSNHGIQVDAVLQCPNIVRELLKTFHKGNDKVKHGCLRLMGNTCRGEEHHVADVVYEKQFYSAIRTAMELSELLCQEAVWICSNVAASDPNHIEQLLLGDEIIKNIVYYARQGENKLRKEAHWTLVNLLRGSGSLRLRKLIQIGVLFTFPSLITSEDARIVDRCLSSLWDILAEYPNWTDPAVRARPRSNLLYF